MTRRPRRTAPRRPWYPLRWAGDERLGRLAATGHEAAFSAVFRRYQEPVYRYSLALLGDPAEAQDVLDRTMTAAWTGLDLLRGDVELRPWLFNIAHTETISRADRARPPEALARAETPER